MFLNKIWAVSGLICVCFTGAFAQVGINTVVPQAQLDIVSANPAAPTNTDGILVPRITVFPSTSPTAAQNGMMVFLTTAVGFKLPGFYYWDNTSTSWMGIGSQTNWNLNGNAATNPTVNFVGTTDNQPLVLGTNGSEKIRVESSGNIGIGISGPLSKLHVRNSTSGMVPNPESVGVFENNTNTYLSLLSGTESGILFGANGTATNGAIIYNPLGVPDAMAFRTNGNTNQMIITSAGNVSIGGFIPTYPLQFNSTLGDKISLWGGSGAHYGFGIQGNLFQMYSATATSDVAFGYGSSAAFNETMRIRGNGSVGIGTTIPNAKLQISASNQANPANTDGIIIPKVDVFPATNPTAAQNGMLVFLTTTVGIKLPGFYYWDNPSATWTSVGSKNNWGLNGNLGTTAANFIGTNDDVDVNFKRNTYKAGRIEATNTAFGSFSMLTANAGTYNTAIGVNSMNTNATGNYNTAMGGNSLFSNVSGVNNTAIGSFSMWKNSIGEQNTAVGNSALGLNIQGFYNTAVGSQSVYSNTTGSANCGFGTVALFSNQTGSFNIAMGSNAMYSNVLGDHNVAIGSHALFSNNTNDNVAIGNYTLYENTTGLGNTAIGSFALNKNVTSNFNTATGYYALNLSTGANNTATGANALRNNTLGTNNTATGDFAMFANTIASDNTANGNTALYQNIDGSQNTADGSAALSANNHGVRNTATGYHAGYVNTTGNFNTAVGAYAYSTGNFSNSGAFGDSAKITANNQIRIGDVGVSSIGGFADWFNASDRRFKTNIHENVPGLEFITKLRPVTYYLDMDQIAGFLKTPDSLRKKDSELIKGKILQTGFIAQEVEQAAKDVNFDFSGVYKPKDDTDFYGLSYAEFVVPLVRAVQEQQVMIDAEKLENAKLREELKVLKETIEKRLQAMEEKLQH